MFRPMGFSVSDGLKYTTSFVRERGNEIQNVLDEFAVRVYHAYAMPLPDVPYRHVLQERAFPRARLSDDVHVLAAVFRSYAELHAAIVRGSFPDGDIQFVKNNKGTLACVPILYNGL